MTGQFRFHEWTFQFDYRRVRTALNGEPGISTKQRRYGSAMQSRSVVADFLALVGLPADLLGDAASKRQNERLSPAQAVSRLMINRAGRPLSEAENDIVHRLLHVTGVADSSLMERLCSIRSITAIEALVRLPDPQAERSLVAWWQDRPRARLRCYVAGLHRRLTAPARNASSALW